MIDALRGRVEAIRGDSVIVGVQGVSFALNVPHVSAFTVFLEVTVFTYMHWNQDSGPQFFGFENLSDRTLFVLLLSVSGVGPRLALAVLRDLDSSVVVDAILRGDSKTLSSVSGLGRKKAETLILTLRDKVESLAEAGSLGCIGPQTRFIAEAISALEALGYAQVDVKNAVNKVSALSQNDRKVLETPEIIKTALMVLSKRS